MLFNFFFFFDKLQFKLSSFYKKIIINVFIYRYKKLNAALISLVEDYSLVSFIPLDVSNQALLLQVKNAVDKANGYIFGGNEPQDVQTLLACAVGAVSETKKMSTIDAYL